MDALAIFGLQLVLSPISGPLGTFRHFGCHYAW